MTPQNIITEARYILLDTSTTAPRQTDDELLGYVNGGLKEMVTLQPLLFSTIGDLVCTPSQCEQAIRFSDAAALIDVLCVHGGRALTPFEIAPMNAFNPNWRTDTAAVARQWAKYPGDPLRFFIYPKAPISSQTLDVRYARNPTEYAIGDTITDVPPIMQSALVDYVVYRSESKDDENVLGERAKQFYASFVAKVKG